MDGLETLRFMRRRGEVPTYPVVLSTVGEVGTNLHVHLDLRARPDSINWSPLLGLDAFAVIGKGHARRFLSHAARVLRYSINQHPGWKDYLLVWDIDSQAGLHIKRWPALRSIYPELCQEEEVEVRPLLSCEAIDFRGLTR